MDRVFKVVPVASNRTEAVGTTTSHPSVVLCFAISIDLTTKVALSRFRTQLFSLMIWVRPRANVALTMSLHGLDLGLVLLFSSSTEN